MERTNSCKFNIIYNFGEFIIYSDTPNNNFDKYRNLNEVKLIDRIISGNKKAIEQLFEIYREMILKISESYVENKVSSDKVVDIGNEGLLKAAKRYQDTVGFNYSAYAAWWVRESIVEYRSLA